MEHVERQAGEEVMCEIVAAITPEKTSAIFRNLMDETANTIPLQSSH